MFNVASLQQPTGLETLLQRWGVNVMADYVKDSQSSSSDQFVKVNSFNPNTFVNPLMQFALEMVLPRPVLKIDQANPPANAPQVAALVASGETSPWPATASPRRAAIR